MNMHLFGLGAAAESVADGQDEARMVLQLAGTGVVIGGSFTDAATGLNVRASSTPAERVEGGFKIHGRKAFCSLAPALDVFYGTAGLTDGSGLLLFAIGRDAPGLSFVDTWDTMAMRGTGSWDVVFDNVFVPEFMAQVGTPWDEWDRRSERMLAWFSCTVASVYLGIAEAALQFTASYLGDRKLGGMTLPIARQPGIIFGAGEVDALIRPARALLERDARGAPGPGAAPARDHRGEVRRDERGGRGGRQVLPDGRRQRPVPAAADRADVPRRAGRPAPPADQRPRARRPRPRRARHPARRHPPLGRLTPQLVSGRRIVAMSDGRDAPKRAVSSAEGGGVGEPDDLGRRGRAVAGSESSPLRTRANASRFSSPATVTTTSGLALDRGVGEREPRVRVLLVAGAHHQAVA